MSDSEQECKSHGKDFVYACPRCRYLMAGESIEGEPEPNQAQPAPPAEQRLAAAIRVKITDLEQQRAQEESEQYRLYNKWPEGGAAAQQRMLAFKAQKELLEELLQAAPSPAQEKPIEARTKLETTLLSELLNIAIADTFKWDALALFCAHALNCSGEPSLEHASSPSVTPEEKQ